MIIIAMEALTGLTLHDYCDAEPGFVQAWVRVAKDSQQVLDLCKHHFEVMEPALVAAGFTIVDDRRAELR